MSVTLTWSLLLLLSFLWGVSHTISSAESSSFLFLFSSFSLVFLSFPSISFKGGSFVVSFFPFLSPQVSCSPTTNTHSELQTDGYGGSGGCFGGSCFVSRGERKILSHENEEEVQS